MSERDKLKKLAAECRECADTYERNPGLAGPGSNAGTIADLYLTIARLADVILAVPTETEA